VQSFTQLQVYYGLSLTFVASLSSISLFRFTSHLMQQISRFSDLQIYGTWVQTSCLVVLCLVCACNAIHSHCPCSHGNHCVSTIILSQHQWYVSKLNIQSTKFMSHAPHEHRVYSSKCRHSTVETCTM